MSRLREGLFAIGDLRGTVRESQDGWVASLDGASAQHSTPIGAILGLIPNERPEIILTDLDLRNDEAEENEAHGVPFLEGSWIHLSDLIPNCGEDVTEHPEFVEWASVYSTLDEFGDPLGEDDEVDEDRPELYRVGGLGCRYFLLDVDGWTWRLLGWFDSPEAAAEGACDFGQEYEMH